MVEVGAFTNGPMRTGTIRNPVENTLQQNASGRKRECQIICRPGARYRWLTAEIILMEPCNSQGLQLPSWRGIDPFKEGIKRSAHE